MRIYTLAGFLGLGILAFASTALAAGSTSRSKPESTSNTYTQAVAAVNAEDYQRALRLLDKVIDNTPNDADAWNYKGFSHRHLGQQDAALNAYERALRIDPEHRGALEYLGELYVQQDQLDKARQQLERLDDACGFLGCEEYTDLKNAIDSHQASRN